MYTTNLPRAALAILVGTIVGAILVALWSFWGNTDLQYLRAYWQRDALIAFTYAAFVWAAGLFVVAPGLGRCFIATASVVGRLRSPSEPR
jgi:hypothetical protein